MISIQRKPTSLTISDDQQEQFAEPNLIDAIYKNIRQLMNEPPTHWHIELTRRELENLLIRMTTSHIAEIFILCYTIHDQDTIAITTSKHADLRHFALHTPKPYSNQPDQEPTQPNYHIQAEKTNLLVTKYEHPPIYPPKQLDLQYIFHLPKAKLYNALNALTATNDTSKTIAFYVPVQDETIPTLCIKAPGHFYAHQLDYQNAKQAWLPSL